MSIPPSCYECGRPLPANAPGGTMCPACLFAIPGRAPAESDPAPPEHPEIPGHRILGQLSEGGMGVVFRARQLSPGREVALKMMLPPIGRGTKDLVGRFRLEIRTLAEMDHPGILPLYDVGEAGSRLWFTMKLASGGSLAQWLRERRRPFKPAKAAALIAAMADALQHAHSRGVLHRDIKPGNILFGERDEAFLADFGLAKLIDGSTDLTNSAAVVGTPQYMAPEIAIHGSRFATIHSDIYSLGAVLYELLSGRPPFVVEGLAALVKKIAEEEPERPSTLAANIPRDLELICLTCLAREPGQRYPTASALADDLHRWERGEPLAARRTSNLARFRSWVKRRPALAAVSGALILTLLAGGISVAVRNRQLADANRQLEVAVTNAREAREQISGALTVARESRERADAQAEFLIGEFVDRLGAIGQSKIIREACAEVEKLDRPADDAGRRRRAKLLLRWASAEWTAGDGVSAIPRLREAIGAMTGLAAANPDDGEALKLGVRSRCLLASVLAGTISYSEGLEVLDAADGELLRLKAMSEDEALPLSAEIDITRAGIFGLLKLEKSRVPSTYNRAIDSLRRWRDRAPADRERTVALARALREMGDILFGSINRREPKPEDPLKIKAAKKFFEETIDLLKALPDRNPSEEFELATATGWLGDCYLRMPDKGPAAAGPLIMTEHETVKRLLAVDPLNLRWQAKLLGCQESLYNLYRSTGRDAEATEVRVNRQRLRRMLFEQFPGVREWKITYGNSLLEDVDAILPLPGQSLGIPVSVETKVRVRPLLDLVAAESWKLVTAQPASITEQDGWYRFTVAAAQRWEAVEDWVEAESIYRKAIAAGEAEAARSGDVGLWWNWTLAGLYRRAAECRVKQSDPKAALSANINSLKLRESLLRLRTPFALSDVAAVPHSFSMTSSLQLKMQLFDDALETAGAAVALYVKCRDVAGKVTDWADPVLRVVAVSAGLGGEIGAKARRIAAGAAHEFFPGDRSGLTDKARQTAAALDALGAGVQFDQ